MSLPKIGFLFDIDGTLTSYRRNDSYIDLLLINDLELIRKMNYPLGFVTGRSIDWVKNTFFEFVNKSLQDYIFVSGEYGLVNFYQGKKTKYRILKEIKELLTKVKAEIITAICDYKELIPLESYKQPDHRCLWIEPKEIMVTIRSLPLFGLTTDKYERIVSPIMEQYSDKLKAVPNKYALDILPINISKKIAAEKTVKTLDPNKEIIHWFAFGDSEVDREMGYISKRNVNFLMVKQGNTTETHYLIEKALAGKLSKIENEL
ncbi:MAG: HAD-IIB family hydrolase [Candidatus Heimdallarchaeota archaeon]|nr:HAD-IIB family hydrolase [Candidatus Heimdallarchaeota archaeon]